MKNRRFFHSAACLFAAAVISIPVPALADEGKIKAAQQAAETWAKLIDDGKYAESWDESSSMFKKKVPKEKWAEMSKGAREPLGKLTSRKLGPMAST